MTNEVKLDEIATRVSALVAGRYGDRLGDAAAELGIAQPDLRAFLERRVSLTSTGTLVELLTRVVRRFGIDPAWLVTGRYDVRSHIFAEENRGDPAALRYQVRRLVSGPDLSVAIDPVKRADAPPDRDYSRSSEWLEAPSASAEETQQDHSGQLRQGDEPER